MIVKNLFFYNTKIINSEPETYSPIILRYLIVNYFSITTMFENVTPSIVSSTI